MEWQDRITVNPEQCGGRPCIRGMRIRVSDVLDLFAAGLSADVGKHPASGQLRPDGRAQAAEQSCGEGQHQPERGEPMVMSEHTGDTFRC